MKSKFRCWTAFNLKIPFMSEPYLNISALLMILRGSPQHQRLAAASR